MEVFAFCMECQKELGHPTFEPFIVPYYDDRLGPAECSRGHKSVLLLQSQKFEVLLESGANALTAGFTFEAAGVLRELFLGMACAKDRLAALVEQPQPGEAI
jgi:hypothetical protein